MADKNYYSIDSYDKLFCKCDGTTTTFVDSSTANPKTITANGNATQLSLPEAFAGKRTAGFFNGTTDYVVIPDSADWDFGGSDFSIQFYINFLSIAGNTAIISRDAGSWRIILESNSKIRVLINTTTFDFTFSDACIVNTWYKVKVERVGTSLKGYLNDIEKGSTTINADVTASSTPIYIASSSTPSGYQACWIKNLTITKAGTTVLDMKFDSPATSPLGPAIAFDGTGDYLTLAYSSDWDVASDGAYTIEFFVKFSTVANTYLISRQYCSIYYASGTFHLLSNAGDATFSLTPTAGAWYHMAGVKQTNGTLDIYVNGVKGTSSSDSTAITYNDVLNIGRAFNNTQLLTGFMREIRYSNTARYTTAFTPSQTGFTVDANTKLYIKGDEDNGAGNTLIPSMSSNSAPTPFAASGVGGEGVRGYYIPFDGDDSTYYQNSVSGFPVENQIDMGANYVVDEYRIKAPTTYYPKTWTFQASLNGSSWTTLDTQTNITAWTGLWNTFQFTNTTAYRYYKLVTTVGENANTLNIYTLKIGKKIVDSETSPKTISVFGDTKIKYTEDYRSCIFKDETGKFPYPVGSAKVDFFAIGSGVGYFPADGYLTIPDSDDWDVQQLAFTNEAYVRIGAVGTNDRVVLVRTGANYSYYLAVSAAEKGIFKSNSGGSSRWSIEGSTIMLPNTWYHLAGVSTGSAQQLYVNGTKEGSDGSYNSALTDTTDGITIGTHYDQSLDFNGLLDNIRISKGVARYTSTFNTPEVRAFIPRAILI